MIGGNDKITKGQNATLIIGMAIGVGVLSLPSTLAKEVGPNGWVTILIVGFIFSILTILLTKVCKKYEGQTFVEFGRILISRPIADAISIIYLIYLIVLIAYIMRVFAEVVKMFLLRKTPTEVIIISMLLVTSYLARKGIEGIARMIQLIIPIVFIPLFLLYIVILPDIHLDNLLPIMNIGAIDIIKSIPIVLFSYLGYEILFFTIAYVDRKEKILRYNIIAILSITLVYLTTFFITLTRFGEKELIHLLWPSLTLMRTVEIPGAFIENVEGVVMALWTLVVFASIAPSCFGAALIISKLTKSNEYKHYVLPIIPIVYLLSLVPDNLAITYEYMDLFTYYIGTFVSIILPVLYFVISLFKKQRKEGVIDES